MQLMKLLTLTFALTLGLFATPAFAAPVAIVGISPDGSPDEVKTRTVRALQFVTEQTAPGQMSVIFDAKNNTLLCSFSVPDKKSYASEKAKLQYNGGCAAKAFAAAKTATPGRQTADLDPIGFFKAIGFTYELNADTKIVLIGSPIVDDARELATSMADTYVPTDGHISADPSQSPFSLKSYEGRFNGARLYWVTPDNWAANHDHAHQVKQFWGLAVQYLGGELVTFDHDLNRNFAMAAALSGEAEPFDVSGSDKIEMIRVVPAIPDDLPIHERRLATYSLTSRDIASARNVEVGIKWNCGGCDVDLYVTAFPTAQTLYFGHKHSPEGLFHKDFTSGRALANGLERVTLPGPIDLSKMTIEVKHYSGLAPLGIAGELRIAIGSQTYAKPFMLAPAGNGRSQPVRFHAVDVVR